MKDIQVSKKNEGDDGRGIPIPISNKTVLVKKVTVCMTDPDATDSSSDEDQEYHFCRNPSKKTKKKPRRLEEGAYFFTPGDERAPAKPPRRTRTTLRGYPGARLRPCGKWAAEVRDPFQDHREWVGTFGNPGEACQAYLAKKFQIYRRKVAEARMNANRRRRKSGTGKSSEHGEETKEG